MKKAQLAIYAVAIAFLTLAPGKWEAARWIGLITMIFLFLMVFFAHRIGGQCKKCGNANTVLYNYYCPKCHKHRR
jgi:thiosulfate reductase cytochrome b subunit